MIVIGEKNAVLGNHKKHNLFLMDNREKIVSGRNKFDILRTPELYV